MNITLPSSKENYSSYGIYRIKLETPLLFRHGPRSSFIHAQWAVPAMPPACTALQYLLSKTWGGKSAQKHPIWYKNSHKCTSLFSFACGNNVSVGRKRDHKEPCTLAPVHITQRGRFPNISRDPSPSPALLLQLHWEFRQGKPRNAGRSRQIPATKLTEEPLLMKPSKTQRHESQVHLICMFWNPRNQRGIVQHIGRSAAHQYS